MAAGQKLRQENPARLKIQKGSLGKNQGKRPQAWRKFLKGRHGQKLHGKKKKKQTNKGMR